MVCIRYLVDIFFNVIILLFQSSWVILQWIKFVVRSVEDNEIYFLLLSVVCTSAAGNISSYFDKLQSFFIIYLNFYLSGLETDIQQHVLSLIHGL